MFVNSGVRPSIPGDLFNFNLSTAFLISLLFIVLLLNVSSCFDNLLGNNTLSR